MTENAERTDRIQTPALQACLEHGQAPRLLDVRSPAEFETAHVDGAVNVPIDLLRQHADEVAALVSGDAVLLCQSGPRADEAKRLLEKAGRPGLRVLDGGINAWESSGAPLRRGKETWALERQVRFTAGSLVVAGVLGSLFASRARFLAGAVGGGLVFSAVTNTCAMGNLLSRMPWNQSATAPDAKETLGALAA